MEAVGGYCVKIAKMILDDLPSFKSDTRGTGLVKVIFRTGTAAAETQPKKPNAYGAIEWTERIEMWVNDGDETLVATIVSRESSTDPWRLVTGGRFEHSVRARQAVWKRRSDTPGIGPNFHAELKALLQRDRSWRWSQPLPTFSTTTQNAVGKSHAASAIRRNPDLTVGEGGAAGDLTLMTRFGAGGVGRAQRGRTTHTRSESFSSYFVQRISSFMRDGSISVESGESTFTATTDEAFARSMRQTAVISESTVPPTSAVESRASAPRDMLSNRVSRQLDVEYRVAPLGSFKRKASSTSNITRAPSFSTSELQLAPIRKYGGIPWKGGPMSAGGDVRGAGRRGEFLLFGRMRKFAGATSDAAVRPSKLLSFRRGTAPLSSPSSPVEETILPPVVTKTRPRGTEVPFPYVVGKAPRLPSPSLSSPRPSPTAANIESPPPLFDEQASRERPVVVISALRGARTENENERERESLSHDHPDVQRSTLKDGAQTPPGARFTRIPSATSTHNAARAPNTPADDSSDTAQNLKGDVTPFAPITPWATAESCTFAGASAVPITRRFAARETTDLAYAVSISPRLVYAGCHFQLRVSARWSPAKDDVFRGLSRNAEDQIGIPAAMSGEQTKRVTMKLVPKHVLKVLDASTHGSSRGTGLPGGQKVTENVSRAVNTNIHDSNKACDHRPSVQAMVWDEDVQHATFTVECLPGAPAGVVECGAWITDGSSIATYVSFQIEVVETECGDTAVVVEESDTSVEEIETDAVEVGRDVPGSCNNRALAKRMRACPPAPLLLASRVGPGAAVCESKEFGFRLTVQDGSLRRAIGPITVREFAQVVKCKDDGVNYLVKAVVDCQPSGITFADAPILMDFMVTGSSPAKIAESHQVLVCKDEADGWRKVKSEVRVDEWGTYMRAAISDFCFFICGRELHPGDPVRLEDSADDGMIEVQNATNAELFVVLVPVSFDSDRTSRVTYTGSIGFGVAGVTFEAGGSSGRESEVKSHILPAGFIPDDVSIPSGGTFPFNPPAQSGEGKLLIATIAEDSQAGASIKVVVLHGKFSTPAGKRRIILPVFLQGKSRISARLGPDDCPVEMVMIMAGLGSKTNSPTVAISPEDSMRLATTNSAASASPVPAGSQGVQTPATNSRGSSSKRCAIS